MGNSRKQREATPEDCAEGDDELTRVPIRQRAYERRRHHVKTQKRAGEIAQLRLAKMKFILHQRLNRKQHIAIRVVKQIERCENDERSARIKFRVVHERI